MTDTTTSIVSAINILRQEGNGSQAIGVLEDALKKVCKLYIMDMSSMSSAIGSEEVKQALKN